MWYALLTLVALSGEVVLTNGLPTIEHYAAPYPTQQGCIIQANIMAGQKDACRTIRPDKPCMEAWVASCTQDEPR